jgi:hypothetical protein
MGVFEGTRELEVTVEGTEAELKTARVELKTAAAREPEGAGRALAEAEGRVRELEAALGRQQAELKEKEKELAKTRVNGTKADFLALFQKESGVARTVEVVTLVQKAYRGFRERFDRQIECDAEQERRATRRYYKMLASRHLEHMERKMPLADAVEGLKAAAAGDKRSFRRHDRECWWTPGQMATLSPLERGRTKRRRRIEIIGERQVCHYMTQPLVELYGGCMVVLKASGR